MIWQVIQEDFPKDEAYIFKFTARYFPEDAEAELITDITRRMFFLQVETHCVFGLGSCFPVRFLGSLFPLCCPRYHNFNVATSPLLSPLAQL